MPDSRIVKQAYVMLTRSNIPDDFNWASLIERCLSNLGFAYIFNCGGIAGANEKRILSSLKQRMRDCFLQEWRSNLRDSSRFSFYQSFKTAFECEQYLSFINIKKFRDVFIRFRFGCNELRVNTRNKSDPNISTNCPFCGVTENELHFIKDCQMYIDLRQKYLEKHLNKFNSSNLQRLMSGNDVRTTRDISMYIYYALELRSKKINCTGT